MQVVELQKSIDNWIKTLGVRYFDVMTNTLILNEEVGEFSRLIARIYGEQSFKQEPSEVEKKEMIADELTDILWVTICLANQLGVDLTESIEKNINKKSRRDATRHINNEKLK